MLIRHAASVFEHIAIRARVVPAARVMVPLNTEREMPVMVMMRVTAMSATVMRMMPAAFDLGDGVFQIIRIALRGASAERDSVGRRSEEHRAGGERQPYE